MGEPIGATPDIRGNATGAVTAATVIDADVPGVPEIVSNPNSFIFYSSAKTHIDSLILLITPQHLSRALAQNLP